MPATEMFVSSNGQEDVLGERVRAFRANAISPKSRDVYLSSFNFLRWLLQKKRGLHADEFIAAVDVRRNRPLYGNRHIVIYFAKMILELEGTDFFKGAVID